MKKIRISILAVTFISALALILSAKPVLAKVIFDLDFDDLLVGSIVPEFEGPPVIVENESFNSPPNGALFNSDEQSNLFMPQPLLGIITVEVWMDPKPGSDTNFVCRLESQLYWGKNDSDRYFYTDRSGQVFFGPVVDGLGHSWKIVVDNVNGTFDLYFDGVLYANDAPTNQGPGIPLELFDCNSGRGGTGQPSYLDDLLIKFRKAWRR